MKRNGYSFWRIYRIGSIVAKRLWSAKLKGIVLLGSIQGSRSLRFYLMVNKRDKGTFARLLHLFGKMDVKLLQQTWATTLGELH